MSAKGKVDGHDVEVVGAQEAAAMLERGEQLFAHAKACDCERCKAKPVTPADFERLIVAGAGALAGADIGPDDTLPEMRRKTVEAAKRTLEQPAPLLAMLRGAPGPAPRVEPTPEEGLELAPGFRLYGPDEDGALFLSVTGGRAVVARTLTLDEERQLLERWQAARAERPGSGAVRLEAAARALVAEVDDWGAALGVQAPPTLLAAAECVRAALRAAAKGGP